MIPQFGPYGPGYWVRSGMERLLLTQRPPALARRQCQIQNAKCKTAESFSSVAVLHLSFCIPGDQPPATGYL
jgi:hypothetical protein